MNLTIEQLLEYLAIAVTVASVVRLVLHWLRGLLTIWLPFHPERPSGFWRFFDKFDQTLAYVALSLGAYGKKEVLVEKISQQIREKEEKQNQPRI